MKVYTDKDSSSYMKVMIASSYAGITLNVANFSAAKEIMPQVATFKDMCDVIVETSKGFVVGSDSAIRYFARIKPEMSLYGECFYHQSEVDMWIQFANQDQNTFASNMSSIDEKLLYSTYLVGHNVTLADITVAITIQNYKSSSNFDTSNYANLERWYNTITQQKQYIKAMPKEDSSKQQKPQPKNVAKSPSTTDEEQSTFKEEDVGELKLSTMDEWKKFYSNSKNKSGEAMPWFWNNKAISENYSIWYMKYNKLPTEGKLDFITSNLLNGFMQRVDNSMRGESFGLLHVVGEPGDYDIQGVWLFKGNDIPDELKGHPSFEYQFFTKLDFSSSSDQQIVCDYWCNTETAEGRPVVAIQVWK